MLYLPSIQSPTDSRGSASAMRLSLSEATARRIEHALLSTSQEGLARELSKILAGDKNLSEWTSAAAKSQGQREFTQPDEAAEWLASNLLTLWAGHLEESDPASQTETLPTETLRTAFADRTDSTQQKTSDERDEARQAGPLLPQLLVRLRRLEALETEFQHQLEHEKLEAMKELAYGAGHEINNPLANISLRAQTLLQEETDPQRCRAFSAINAQAFRAHEMIADLMLLARPPKIVAAPLALGPFLDHLAEAIGPRLQERAIDLTVRPSGEPILAQADEKQLAVVINALCKNAMESIGTGGHLVLSSCVVPPSPALPSTKPWGVIQVLDDGPGVPDEVRPKLFDPFYSGRESGRGLGLGLSKCWRIVRDHGGHLEVKSSPASGTTFSVHLPLAS